MWLSYCICLLPVPQEGAGLHLAVRSFRHLSHSFNRHLRVLGTGRIQLRRGTSSIVVGRGLSCSEACGIFPDQGLNLCPLHWQADSYPLHHQGSPHGIFTCLFFFWVSLVARMVKNLSKMHETEVHSLGREDPLEKGMATHSSILDRGAWWATVHGITKSRTWLSN